VIHRHSKTFTLATALLPPGQRRAIRALYAFCRATDDLVDSRQAGLEQVEAWRRQTDRPANEQSDPILRAWVATRDAYAIARRYEQELIDGVALDLTVHRYARWHDLERYCYLVASTVGLMSIPILGLADGVGFEQAAPYAVRLGVALQLTNILRDVGEDAGRGRIYLPQDDLERFALTDNDIFCGTYDDRFRHLMRFEISRARHLVREALPGIALLAPSARVGVGAAALLYRDILNQIERQGYDVFTRRAHTGRWRKLRLLPGIAWTVARLQPRSTPATSSEPASGATAI
jgi:phytoene synthase